MRLYNTQTRDKEDFVPLEPGKVKMYVCGPTVYNYFHLGNARPFIIYDTLRRYLEFCGLSVTYVQNFTDIDDKMINKANAEGVTVFELADRFIDEYFHDADRLSIHRATLHPRATESMPMIISLIETLVDKGFAYETGDGVYFDIAKMPDYGKLSHYNPEDLESGGRELAGDDSDKHNALDFALWKKKKEGEPFWPSPWGDGRPGWHIECSAMVKQHLGDTIDIHGGGQDLVFPHHENEIAQSEAANGKPFVRYWLHNGFINIDHTKMSKSAGNFFTVRDLVEHFDYPILRFFMLSGHYRMPINFSSDLLQAAENGWNRIRTCLKNLAFVADHAPEKPDADALQASRSLQEATDQCQTAFVKAMDDDLNTADALAAIFDLVRAANTAATATGIDAGSLQRAAQKMTDLLAVLGLDPLAGTGSSDIPEEVNQLVAARAEAKGSRDFARADALRDQIQQLGYAVADTPQGPKVSRL
ncbi:MAG: cysteine--tRNA ligase [Bacillota bacterium]|nr:cysteine--tRNA ligase [Bacillota bacterium]